MRLPVQAKFIIMVFLGVFIPLELSVFYVLRANQKELDRAFLRQGRMMADQIVITRRWLSSHGGVYVHKRPFVKDSPYMEGADTATIEGDAITLRTPFTVTRELSELSSSEGQSRFRIVSLKPINPANKPDGWEESSLLAFENGVPETWTETGDGKGARYRYMAPLFIEKSCHRCHVEFKYPVGSVRGGVSVDFPVGDILVKTEAANRNYAIMAAALGLISIALMWAATRLFVLNPLSRISRAVSAIAEGDYDMELALRSNDELGDLASTFIEARAIIHAYSRKLEEEVADRTADLERMRAHAQRERDYLINIFERMADGVCVVSDQDHGVEYMNPRLGEAFGRADDKKCYELFFEREDTCENCPPSEPEDDTVVRGEITGPGDQRIFDVLSSRLENTDGGSSRLFVFRDITERKRLEERLREMNRTLEAKVKEQTEAILEKEKLAALGEVSAGLAHEIRNPLSAILSGISLLETDRRTIAERDHIFKLIKREGKRLNAALTDFLLFARPRDPKKVRIDLVGLVREIVQMIEDDPELKGDVEIMLVADELAPIWFDDDQLRQVIWNVVLNGLQAMEGSGKLIVRTRDQGDGTWRLDVQDTGPGIGEDVSEKIFSPFFSTKKQGTGLGLSIVRRILSAHGGIIAGENMPGGGCRFTIAAPMGDGPGENHETG